MDDKSSAKFLDNDFPPVKESLIPSDPNHDLFNKIPKKSIEEYSTYDWYRLYDIYENKEKLFITNPELQAEDILQGTLGSCYLLCAIGGLVKNNPAFYKNLFVIKEENKKGIYAVKFLIQGVPMVVVVDDFIPCKTNKNNKAVPAFSSSRNREASVLILEKAWAKLNYKCFMKTWYGTPQEALHCLLEAPSVYEYHSRYSARNHENAFWIKLCEARLRKWILCANTENVKEEEIGLPSYHAYLILEIYEVAKDNRTFNNYATLLENIVANRVEYDKTRDKCIQLIKIRNPTGESSKFKGEYCEGSSNWTMELKRAVGNQNGTNVGSFYVTLHEFLKYFSWTFICKIEENFQYRAAKFKIDQNADHIEYLQNKGIIEIVEPEEIKENGDNSWNSDLLENDLEDRIKKPGIAKNLPVNQKASILNEENKKLNIKTNFKNKPSDIPGMSQISSISPHSNFKKLEYNNINNQDDNLLLKEIEDNLIDSNKKKIFFKLNNIIAASFIIQKKSKCYITLHQPHHRFICETIKNYQIPLALIIVVKYNSQTGTYNYVDSEFINWEKLILDCYLSPGEYHIFARCYWTYHPLEHDLVISTYSDQVCELYELKKNEMPSDWLDRILIDIAKSGNKIYFDKEESTSFYSHIMPDFKYCTGFGCFYFENNSTNGDIIVNLNLTKTVGIKLLNGSYLTSFNLKIPSKSHKIILYQITEVPWVSELKYNQEIWFEYSIDYLVKKYGSNLKLSRIEIEPQLYLSEVKYERGYILIITNNSNSIYKSSFSFSKMKNYIVDKFTDHKNVQVNCNAKSQNYLNIKCNKHDKDPNFKLVYKQKFIKD